MYDFTVRNLHYVVRNLDADHDGWPEGLGNVERTGMGPEKLDNTVYFIRGLYDLADMARAKHDGATVRLGHEPGPVAAAALRPHLVVPGGVAVRRLARATRATRSPSRSTGSARRRWRPSCTSTARRCPAWRRSSHGTTALAGRENDCFSGTPPFNPGLFHTGCGGGANGQGEKVIFGLTTSIQSVGEGNYGRLGAGRAAALHPRARRADVLRARDRRDAGRAARRDAGDLPVTGSGREHRPLLDLPIDVHAGLGQLRNRLGGRPPVAGRPAGPRPRATRVRAAGPAGPDLRARAGTSGSAAGPSNVRASHAGNRYRTDIDVSAAVGAKTVRIGHTLPRGAHIAAVVLDGRLVKHYLVRDTNRGTELTTGANHRGHHTLIITTAS